MRTTNHMSDWEFNNVLLGHRQAVVLHRFHLGDDVWHVCTLDSNDYYHSGYYRFDPSECTFIYLGEERPTRECGHTVGVCHCG